MIEIAAGLSASLIFSIILWASSAPRTTEWEARGFKGVPVKWNTLFLLSTVAALVLSIIGALLGGSFWQIAALGLLGWMTILVSFVDFSTYKIPREPSVISYWLGVPLMLGFAYSIGLWAPIAAFGVWMLMPTLLVLFSRGGIGMGDIRLLILFGTTLSWWIGIEYMFMSIVAASLIQLVIYAIALITGRGKRAVIGDLARQELMDQGVIEKDEEITITEQSQLESAAVNTGETQETSDSTAKKKPPKKRLHLPFGPSLMWAYVAVGIYSLTRSIGTCDIFMLFLC